MKYIKKFENNTFQYGDYLIYQKFSWRKEKGNLCIMSIGATPRKTKFDDGHYTVNELYELIDNKLEYINNFNPKQYTETHLEEHCLYKTKSLEDAKETIFAIADSKKYNI